MATVLLIPGLWNSGPDHWHSHWEKLRPEWRRVPQADWNTPHKDAWVEGLEREVAAAHGTVVLVAHSLACCLVSHWAQEGRPASVDKVRGALLVAPSDPEAPSYPKEPRGFAPMPLQRLPFPSTVVASTDDQYVSVARAAQFADAWGSRLVMVGAKGHINSASALREWPEGLALLAELG